MTLFVLYYQHPLSLNIATLHWRAESVNFELATFPDHVTQQSWSQCGDADPILL